MRALTDRHRLAALLLTSGLNNLAVCEKTGLSVNRLSVLKTKPEFIAFWDECRQEAKKRLLDGLAESTIGQIAADGPKNASFLTDLRDGKLENLGPAIEPDILRIRLGAATTLLDRQAPRRIESDSTSTVVIKIEGPQRDLLDEVAREIGAIDVTPGPPLLPRPLEDCLEDLREEET